MIIILIPLFIEMTCFPVYTGMHFPPGLNARLAGKIEINPSPWQRTEIKKIALDGFQGCWQFKKFQQSTSLPFDGRIET